MNKNIVISSIVRWALTALGAWLVSKGFLEKGISLESDSIFEIIFGVISMIVALALKKANEYGVNGKLAAALIGPRIQNMSASMARWVIASVAGITSAYIGMGESDLANSDIASVITLAIGLAVDIAFKKLKP